MPSFDGFTRGSRKNFWTADYLQILDAPIFADSGEQHHRPFNLHLFVRPQSGRRCKIGTPGREANRFSRIDLACLLPSIYIVHGVRLKSVALQIDRDGFIACANHPTPVTTT